MWTRVRIGAEVEGANEADGKIPAAEDGKQSRKIHQKLAGRNLHFNIVLVCTHTQLLRTPKL
jgi:hypothetical protein